MVPSTPFARIVALVVVLLTAAGGLADSFADAPKRVYLSDLPEENVKVGWGRFGKNGNSGFINEYISNRGIYSHKGIGIHPSSHVEYALGGRFRTFRGTAAINESAAVGSDRPVVFTVYGDGKLLWESRGLHSHPDYQPCCLNITGVQRLTLEANYRAGTPGGGAQAHAVWLEPHMLEQATPAETLQYYDPRGFADLEAMWDYDQRVRDLWRREDFEGLDKLSDEAHAKPIFWTEGSQLSRLYGIISEPAAPLEKEFQVVLDRLKKWRTARPKSIAAILGQANCLTNFAWNARGAAFARDVPEPLYRLFIERLKQAALCLDEAEAMKIPDPELPFIRMLGVKGLELKREVVQAIVDKALDEFPENDRVLLEYSTYLSPIWLGQAGDLEAEADRLAKKFPGERGQRIRFQMARILPQISKELFGNSDFTWKDLREGAFAALRKNPANARMVNDACLMSCLTTDEELALPLFERLDLASYSPAVWKSYGEFEIVRARAFEDQLPGEHETVIVPQIGMVRALLYRYKGDELIAAGEAKAGAIVDSQTGRTIKQFRVPGRIHAMAMCKADESLVLSASNTSDGSPGLFSYLYLQEGTFAAYAGFHASVVSDVAVNPAKTMIGTAGHDNVAALTLLDGSKDATKLAHPESVCDIEFSPNGKLVATSSETGGLWFWDAESGKQLGEPLVAMGQGPPRCRLQFADKGKSLYTASSDGTLRRWDVETRKFKEYKPAAKYTARGDQLLDFMIAPDEIWLATSRGNGRVEFRDTETMEVIHTYHGHAASVHALAFHPDGTILASGSDDGSVRLWKVPIPRQK